MPTEEEHSEIALKNKQFQKEIKNGKLTEEYFNWQIVAIFYSAVHTVDKTLHCAGHIDNNIRNHDNRFSLIKDSNFGIDLRSAYKTLFDLAREARYENKAFTETIVNGANGKLFLLEQAAYKERIRLKNEKK